VAAVNGGGGGGDGGGSHRRLRSLLTEAMSVFVDVNGEGG
jgi:hypothetical protein